jgi:hypothetical protein
MSVRVVFSRKLYRELFNTGILLDTNDASATAIASFARSDSVALFYNKYTYLLLSFLLITLYLILCTPYLVLFTYNSNVSSSDFQQKIVSRTF